MKKPNSPFLKTVCAKAQRGVAMIEFALIAPILLALIFAVIEFSVMFATLLSINYAASEAAREVAVYDPRLSTQDYSTRADAAMREALPEVVPGLADRLQFQVTQVDGCNGTVDDAVCLELTITYPNYSTNPAVPGVFSGLIPGADNLLPTQLTSTAVTRIPVRFSP